MNNPFRRRPTGTRLSSAQADRQGRICQFALAVLEQADAIAFLNAHDAALGGRPIDLAVASTEGFSAVERVLAARKAGVPASIAEVNFDPTRP